jgi:hypothetical protein
VAGGSAQAHSAPRAPRAACRASAWASVWPCARPSSASLSNGDGGSGRCRQRAPTEGNTRFLRNGLTTPPCAVPVGRTASRPARGCRGAVSQRSLSSRIPFAVRVRSQGLHPKRRREISARALAVDLHYPGLPPPPVAASSPGLGGQTSLGDTRRSRAGTAAPPGAPGPASPRSGRSEPRRGARRAPVARPPAWRAPPLARRGEVAARGSAVPQLVELGFHLLCNLRDRFPLEARGSVSGFDALVCLPPGVVRTTQRRC